MYSVPEWLYDNTYVLPIAVHVTRTCFRFVEGYSVGAGHFRSRHTTEVVGGAPQHEQIGKVRTTFLYLFLCKGSNTLHDRRRY